MKRLLPALLVISGLVWYSCSKQDAGFQNVTLKTPVDQLVLKDGNVDNFVEAADYEADLFSMGETSLSAYSTKSATIGMGGMFFNMFERYLNFRMRYRNGVGPNITLTTTNGKYPKTIVLDYGDSLALANGRVLSGMITITLSGPDTITGTTRSIIYDKFSNGYSTISGTATKTRLKNSTQKVFSTTSDMNITFADTTSMSRTEDKTMTWVSGADTQFNPADDMIDITGKVQVTDRKGNEYSKTITTALVKTGECRYITKGVVEFKTSAGKFATLDYGNGDCDNLATIATATGNKEITLGH
jgi:hypothetical protein